MLTSKQELLYEAKKLGYRPENLEKDIGYSMYFNNSWLSPI